MAATSFHLVAVAAADTATQCPTLATAADDSSVLTFHAFPGKQSFQKVKKKTLLTPVNTALKPVNTAAKFCVLTAEDLAKGITCSNAPKPAKELTLYECTTVDKKQTLTTIETAAKLNSSTEVYVAYKAETDSTGTKLLYMRFEGKDKDSADAWSVMPIAVLTEGYEDKGYLVNLYAGANMLFTGADFSKTFPEALVRAEPRFYDQRRGGGQPTHWIGGRWYWAFRGYADAGLSATTACASAPATTSTGSRVSATAPASCGAGGSLQGTKSFVGRVGLGYGAIVPIGTSENDTNAFAFLLVMRLGVTSIPKQDDQHPGYMAFGDLFGLHIENESGHFVGAYVESGLGQSNQFEAQRSARWKTEALVPFTDPEKSARLALRFQVDTVSPLAHLNNSNGDDAKRQLIHSGDIKISLLVNVDIRKFFELF